MDGLLLKDKLKALPSEPGVYFHKDKNGEIIYVGKAANLKNRVKSYFNKTEKDIKTQALVAEIATTDWVTTETELDALFLESEMVKRYMPKFNILLRDDKTVVYLRVDLKSDLPVLEWTREPLDDGAEYLGPYYSAGVVKNALRVLRRSFPYFSKNGSSLRGSSKILRQIGLEPVIENEEDAWEYKANLRKLLRVLRGERVKILVDTEKEMDKAALALEFERAEKLKRQVFALKALKGQIVFADREWADLASDESLRDLADVLGLAGASALQRIEGFDISHQGGVNVVASDVVFKNGVASRRDYRKFKMSREQNNDFENMRETIVRRMKHLEDWGEPSLILVDGGAPQLRFVGEILHSFGLKFVGLAKENEEIVVSREFSGLLVDKIAVERLGGEIYEEEEFWHIKLPLGSPVVKLLQRVRDEAHRFAVNYHTLLKRKKFLGK